MNTKIILELGYNHQGSTKKAKQMIDEAAELGVWGVKLQKWDINGLPEWKKEEPRNDKNAFGSTYYEHRKKLELTIKQLLSLKKYANEKGLVFICSGKDFTSIKELVESGVKWIKVPSQRYGSNEIYRYLIANKQKYGLKIIVSTGMRYENEILNSQWTKKADVIMHCISKYPADLEDCDIAFMLKHRFYNGYSSHEKGGAAIIPAICAGAKYIERHYTYDVTAKGSDHVVSSDFEDVERLVSEIEKCEVIMGNGNRNITDKELEVRDIYRRF